MEETKKLTVKESENGMNEWICDKNKWPRERHERKQAKGPLRKGESFGSRMTFRPSSPISRSELLITFRVVHMFERRAHLELDSRWR